jgi:hypothetical protein
VREEMIEAARDIARRHLDRWLEERQPVTERQYREASQRFVDLADGFLARFSRHLGECASNFFEVAVTTAISLYGLTSGDAAPWSVCLSRCP